MRTDRIKPRILSSQIIRRLDDHHAQLINRTRHGQMIIPGQTLYVLECEPAAYASLAANEAEKAAEINILEVRTSARSAGSTSAARSGTSMSDGRRRWRPSEGLTGGTPGRDEPIQVARTQGKEERHG